MKQVGSRITEQNGVDVQGD